MAATDRVREHAKSSVPVLLSFIAVVFMIVALCGYGWWTVIEKDNLTEECTFVQSTQKDVYPTGTSGSQWQKNCHGGKYTYSSTFPFNDYNKIVLNAGTCASNGHVALGLTVAAIILAAIAIGVHVGHSTSHVAVPVLFMVSSVCAAVAIGIFIEKNPCVAKFKDYHQGGIGV
eukprot:TRINITY_DN1028_c0_g1_i1.p1 TRINITY_DN1028_c0_g1~~TRINITY_DN1028_c0_g1_i1.p1  ORF type:complete len:173 (-),score=44.69 TRINITY_DN1028_c0_g1_i1:279-797(-)